MLVSTRLSALLATLLASQQVLARTDLEGCVSSETIIEKYYASYIWYVPDTGEICSFLDCGGGRAPGKTTVPGCGGYTGTATVTPSFLPGFPKSTGVTTSAQSLSTESTAGAGSSEESTASKSASDTITSSATVPSSSSASAGASASSSSTSSQSQSSVSQAAAAVATGAAREVLGLVVGVVAGVALL